MMDSVSRSLLKVSGLYEVNLDYFMASELITLMARAALMFHFLLPPRKSIIFPFNFMLRENNTKIELCDITASRCVAMCRSVM